MVKGAGWDLLKGCLIGLRYSAVRRQFENVEKGRETKLLDYQSQQLKIFPHFATGISHMICYQLVDKMYKQLIEDCKVGKFDLLDLLHHYTSGFKAVFTEQCLNGLLIIR